MKTIYAVTNGADRNISTAKYYSTKEIAVDALKIIKDERRYRLGVTVIVDSDEIFSFLLGWEEHQVTFSIIPIDLLDNIE
jgi:hypothetical protein